MAKDSKKVIIVYASCWSKIRKSLWIRGPWVIWGTLGEIYNVIIPTVKKNTS